MEICHKNLLGDWTHVLEVMLLTSRLTETCRSKSYGRFSAVISGRLGALLGKSHFFLLGYFSRLKKTTGRGGYEDPSEGLC